MTYFKINDVDLSMYVNVLNVYNNAVYNTQTNAAGNSVVDYINTKRTIEVGIIPLNDEALSNLLTAIDSFNMNISFLNPKTNELEEINCILPTNDISYYTIQAGKVMCNAFTLSFTEL